MSGKGDGNLNKPNGERAKTEYASLEISFHRRDESSFSVQVRFSRPQSETDNRFVEGLLTLSEADFQSLQQLELESTAYGKALTRILFADPQLLSVFVQTRTIVQTLDMPLRIRMLIGPSAPELHGLHWETLQDPLDGSPLFTSENLLFSRYISSADWRPLSLAPKSDSRALVVIANPNNLAEYNLAPVDLQGELMQARKSLKSIPFAFLPDLEKGTRATLNNLFSALREDQYSLLYLACHGTMVNEQPWIWLEDDNGEVSRISGDELVTRFNELQQRPQLIVLASCQSAHSAEGAAISSLGPRLAEAGIPAVIAMQGNISMPTISRIMPAFFEELHRDGQVDRAMAVARGTVRDEDDYWMPALYMRLKSGRIWADPESALVFAEDPGIPIADRPHEVLAGVADGTMPEQQAAAVKDPHRSKAAERTPTNAPGKSRVRLGLVALALIVLAGLILGGLFLGTKPPSEVMSEGMVHVGDGSYASSTGEVFELADYWIDRYEVTNAEYKTYLELPGAGILGRFNARKVQPAYWTDGEIPAGLADHPVRGIAWDQAYAYCASIGKRLPSQAEWEFAARGPYGWDYPWGSQEEAVALPGSDTYTVGAIPNNRSYFGAYDMAGNVWEWVAEPYLMETDPLEKMMLGGGNDIRYKMDYAIAGDPTQALMTANTGIRCAVDGERVFDVPDPVFALQDDFSQTASGWPRVEAPPFIFDFHPEDWYHLEASEPNKFVTAIYDPLRFASFVAETEVFVDSANTDNASGEFLYGLTIHQSDNRFFAFVISGHSKEWQILSGALTAGSNTGKLEDLTVLKSGRAEYINGSAEDQSDRLTVVGNGPEFTFVVNGQIVAGLAAPEYRNGQVGFIAVTLADVTKVHVHFEWVTIQRIEPLGLSGVQLAASLTLTEAVPETDPTPTDTIAEAATQENISERPAPSSIGMARIDAGVYPVGIDNTPTGLDEYWIDRYEVTNKNYANYLDATGIGPPDYWRGLDIPSSMADHPVRGITWQAALDYCVYAGKRLPTELEWEVAARGPKAWQYPWGNEPGDVALSAESTYPVGGKPANRSYFGVFDMVGNVGEWVESSLDAAASGQRVTRGGDFAQIRDAIEPRVADPNESELVQNVGFRCAADQVIAAPDPKIIEYTFADIPGDSARGWRQGSLTVEEGYFVGFHPTDFYHVEVGRADNCLTVLIDEPFANFSIEADSYVKEAKGDGSYRYGLALSETGSEFLAFLISPRDQTWSVLKNTPLGVDLLDEGPAQSLTGFNEETADRIHVIVNESEFSFFVNGGFVSRVYDGGQAVQQAGFIVQTIDETFIHTHFDSLTIQELSDAVETPSNRTDTVPIQTKTRPPCDGSYPVDRVLVKFRPHLVQVGETLSGLASLYGVSQEEILHANALQDPNLIVAGATFLIPLSED